VVRVFRGSKQRFILANKYSKSVFDRLRRSFLAEHVGIVCALLCCNPDFFLDRAGRDQR